MRLHAGQLEDVPAGTQRGCDVPKTSFARWGETQNKKKKKKKKNRPWSDAVFCVIFWISPESGKV